MTSVQAATVCTCVYTVGGESQTANDRQCDDACTPLSCGVIENEIITNVSCAPAGAQSPTQTGEGAQSPTQTPSGGQTSNADFVKRIPLLNPIDNQTYCTVGADNKAVCSTSGIQLISQIANNIIKTLLGLVGIFAMIGFIWGGVTWMTSYGDTAKIERGKKMMIWGVVGLIVIFSSYAIANYIFEAIGATGATTTATTPMSSEDDPAQLLESFN